MWWDPEVLFRKFFFVTGAVGERITRKKVLVNNKRREIYYFIMNFPFSHFRSILRNVGVGANEGAWHLQILEQMSLIKSKRVGRYLTYHANNVDTQTVRPPTVFPNSKASRIIEYLLRNPGAKITSVTQALTMNRNTVSYHIKRLQTNGLVEKLQSNGLRLTTAGDDYGQGLPHTTINHMSPGDLNPGDKVSTQLPTAADAKLKVAA